MTMTLEDFSSSISLERPISGSYRGRRRAGRSRSSFSRRIFSIISGANIDPRFSLPLHYSYRLCFRKVAKNQRIEIRDKKKGTDLKNEIRPRIFYSLFSYLYPITSPSLLALRRRRKHLPICGPTRLRRPSHSCPGTRRRLRSPRIAS